MEDSIKSESTLNDSSLDLFEIEDEKESFHVVESSVDEVKSSIDQENVIPCDDGENADSDIAHCDVTENGTLQKRLNLDQVGNKTRSQQTYVVNEGSNAILHNSQAFEKRNTTSVKTQDISSVQDSAHYESKRTSDSESMVVDEISDEELINSTCLLETSQDLSTPSTYNGVSLETSISTSVDSSSKDKSDIKETSDSCAKSSTELVCPFCGFEEISLYRLEFHVATEHTDFSDSLVENSELLSQVASYSDTALSFSGSNPHDLSSSLVAEDAGQFSCPLCDLDLENAVRLNQHVTTIHPDVTGNTGALSCPLCSFKCDTDDDMKDHVALHEDSTFYGVSPAEEGPSGASVDTSCAMSCPMCGLLMTDTDLLTSHVESHFNPKHFPGKAQVSSSRVSVTNSNCVSTKKTTSVNSLNIIQNQKPTNSIKPTSPSESSFDQDRGNYRKQCEQGLEKACTKGHISVGEYHDKMAKLTQVNARDIEDGQTRVPGLIEKIEDLFSCQSRVDQRVYLSSPTDHFSGSYGDKGWGCGYRNFQMILSCLMRNTEYASKIFPDAQPAIQSIPKLQEMIESAWQQGFDFQGCQQLGAKLRNTRKWIGATEIVATLSSLGVKCHLADFHFPSGSNGTHPRLIEWVSDYFCSDAEFKPPLYLQHQGHSRTIIGVEKEKKVTKLLLFDPGTPCTQMASIARVPLTWKQMHTFRRTQGGFKAKQYQVVAVVGFLSEQEYQGSKTLTSERVT